MNRWIPLVVGGVMLLSPLVATAGPSISLSSSTTQARKGELFHVYVTLSASDDITNLHVTLSLPTGFKLIQHSDVPTSLTAGDSVTADLTIEPPGFSWRPYAPGSDTREEKRIIVNVSYDSLVN